MALTPPLNQNPEQLGRECIDAQLRQAGWVVQARNKIDLNAGPGVAVREYSTSVDPVDYLLFVEGKPPRSAFVGARLRPTGMWEVPAAVGNRCGLAIRHTATASRASSLLQVLCPCPARQVWP